MGVWSQDAAGLVSPPPCGQRWGSARRVPVITHQQSHPCLPGGGEAAGKIKEMKTGNCIVLGEVGERFAFCVCVCVCDFSLCFCFFCVFR